MEQTSEDCSLQCTSNVRILSYNFNILPRGSGGYQMERIEAFLESLDKYDVVMLQEVYAASVLPYALQKRLCAQKRLLDGLREQGFCHYVISRQPSYVTMMRYNLISDNGLVIASRFPIGRRGSYTFRSQERSQTAVPKGCLFAEIQVPHESNPTLHDRIVVFNVHLRPEGGASVESKQSSDMRRYIRNVLLQFRDGDVGSAGTNRSTGVMSQKSTYSDIAGLAQAATPKSKVMGLTIPFVVAGDFGSDGVVYGSDDLSNSPSDFLSQMMLVADVRDVILEQVGFHPPTRPHRLFFPSQSKLIAPSARPQRQDYFLLSTRESGADLVSACIEKFVASARRPYTYLSDHFGISAVVALSDTQEPQHASWKNAAGSDRHPKAPLAGSPWSAAALMEEPVHEQSNPSSQWHLDAVILTVIASICTTIPWKYSLLLGSVVASLWWFASLMNEVVHERPFATVSNDVMSGESAVQMPVRSERASRLSGVDGSNTNASVAELWAGTVYRNRYKKCLAQRDDPTEAEWLTFAAADSRVREIGSGLLGLGALPGEVIGVDAPANRCCVLLELACAVYGFATLTLAGSSLAKRHMIDQHRVHIVVAGRNSVSSLLLCRSRSLEKIVHLQPTSAEDDELLARDLNIQLIPFESVEFQGRINQLTPDPQGSSTPFILAPWTSAHSNEPPEVESMSQGDVVQSIQMLIASKVLGTHGDSEMMVWFAPFTSVFSRICVIGLLLQGSMVVATEGSRLQQVFHHFKPTLLVAHPNVFSPSVVQLKRTNERCGRLYKWVFDLVYQFRSALLHIHHRDSALLRFLFFRSFQKQLGGRVQKVVLVVSEESTSYLLEEHIAVCFAPNVREVCFQLPSGVICIDGVPSPGLRVRLDPMDKFSQNLNIGQLVCRNAAGVERKVDISARWNKNRNLTLLGSPLGILWPVDYHFSIAADVERALGHSRFVTDVFVYCEPCKPLVAIVYPTKDTVEHEWLVGRKGNSPTSSRSFTWSELTEVAVELLIQDFKEIAADLHLHPSSVPQFVHLHPHAFRDHSDFLTPYGRLRRQTLQSYFKDVIDRFYQRPAPTGSPRQLESSSPDDYGNSPGDVTRSPTADLQFLMNVPVVVDIGGTFAKLMYIQPPGEFTMPPYVMHEASSLSESFGGRTLAYFAEPNAAMEQLAAQPLSTVGTVRFARVLSKNVPMLIEYLKKINAPALYRREYVESVRATGGGAFKYSQLVKADLGISLTVVKEMDAVVRGLNLVIRAAPESIFTVDQETGERLPHCLHSPLSEGTSSPSYPYLLINIGSGISFIKVLGPDHSHVRIGGSPIGGATFWGLVRTMTNLTSWQEVIEIMRLDGPGDNTNVDLLVGDIYGYNAKDLPAMLSVDTVASTFGKMGTERLFDWQKTGCGSFTQIADDSLSPLSSPRACSPAAPQNEAAAIDIVRSLLKMIASNVTQLAYLHSKVEGIHNIFFAGGFVRDNPIMWRQITVFLHYWTKGERHAHFLQHDGYLGALGAGSLPLDSDE